MSEIALQSKIAQTVSVRFPKLKGQFFHVSNERNNKIQVFQARSIGIVPGVSDFLLIEPENIWDDEGFISETYTKITGIEVKEPGSYHEVAHVRQQVKWAKVLESCGGVWFLVTSVDEAVKAVTKDYEGLKRIADIEKMLDECKTKTIKF